MALNTDMLIAAGTSYRTCETVQKFMMDNDMLTIQFETGSDMAVLNLSNIQESHAENELCASISKALSEYQQALNRRIKTAIEGRN